MGTRPEALKLSPVVAALGRRSPRFRVIVCFSGQHGALVRDIAREVGLVPDVLLTESSGPQSLSESLAGLLTGVDRVLTEQRPRGVVVQGDTTTALAGGLAAFHHAVPVFHVEAGLRTEDPHRPFPEEMHRRLLSRLASLHLAPTEHARDNLLREGIAEARVVVTGNPIVDTLSAFGQRGSASVDTLLAGLDPARPTLLVTLHRRENEPHARVIAEVVTDLAGRSGAAVLWLRHPNATSRAALEALETASSSHVRLLDPQPYATFIALLARASVVLTDSGGVQEEAPVLGVPVVVLRTETDRPEAVRSGNAVVAGSDPRTIREACERFLSRGQTPRTSPFGDGRAGERIAAAIDGWFADGR